MANNTFYTYACNINAKHTPYPVNVKANSYDEGLNFYTAEDEQDGKLLSPHSIMNDNVAINYRTIYNGYPLFGSTDGVDFTEYSDYERCMTKDATYSSYLAKRRNPTYKNIIETYGNTLLDPHGLARYKMQDFIYLKYYNQIPNNYMITLRRYTRPTEDHMFSLDMAATELNGMNDYPKEYTPIATAVTYMGEKAGNKLSDIMKFEYGAEWEEKTGETQSLQNSDGGLAAQMRQWGINTEDSSSRTSQVKSLIGFSAAVLGKGKTVNAAMSAKYNYEGNAFNERYGEELYGDVNVVNKVKIRSRGLTFSNSFSLNFEYSLKSLKCVNPKIAMLDIICNFLILTGNYGTFWGGATMFFGNRNIAPQYGDPTLLRQGKYGAYIKSLANDVKTAFTNITGATHAPQSIGEFFKDMWSGAKNIGSGFIQGLLGNLLGGNIGVAGEAQVPKALLSGAPSGFWHLTVGNPLDPIAMMGNMAVTKTTVTFSDYLGYDDFPTEVKFTVEMEHCRPRDNAGIENMFNAAKGRFYAFTDGNIEKAYHSVNTMQNFQGASSNQETNTYSDMKGNITTVSNHKGTLNNTQIKSIGGFLNG